VGNVPSQTGLSSGLYYVSILDSKGCQTVANFTIEEVVPPVVDLNIGASCPGLSTGSVQVNTSGGVAPFQYQWSIGGPALPVRSNLAAGNYTLTIVDGKGCRSKVDFAVNEVVPPVLSLSTSETCPGEQTGSVRLMLSGGEAPFRMQWSTGAGNVNSLTNLASGSYTVTVEDSKKCLTTQNFSIGAVSPPAVDLTLLPTCPGQSIGSAEVTLSGGTGPFQYKWSSSAGDVPVLTGLKRGSYSLTIVDGKACKTVRNFEIAEKSPFTLLVNPLPVACFGESSGKIEITNHQSGWLYSLDGLVFQDRPVFENLPEGDYDILVQDADGCTSAAETSIESPPVLNLHLTASVTVVKGNGELLLPSFGGGNGGYLFNWVPAEGLSCTDCPTPLASPDSTTTYTLRLTDKNNCATSAAVKVLVERLKLRDAYFPNVFSPNDDGINDYFTGFGSTELLRIKYIRVFDRWGAIIFARENLPPNEETYGWNGTMRNKKMPEGVYVWYAEVEWSDRETTVFQGDVMLVR
jgi:gliding motility-associated-like protein